MHLVSAYPSDIAVARAMRGQRGVISVVDLAALKALKSRTEVVIVETGQAKGVWQWALGDSTTADDALVVQCTAGTAGRYKRIYDGPDVYASWFGAVGDGTTDDVVALQAAIDAVNAAGGGNVHCGGGRWLIDSANLNLKAGVTLLGSWRTFGRPGDNVGDFSTIESAFIINPTYTISNQAYDAGIQGMVILRKGLTAPTDIRSAVDAVADFSGTAITVGNGSSNVAADCWLSNLFICGFAQAISHDWGDRSRYSYIQGDNIAGIYIVDSFDMQQLSNVHFWPFLTSGFTPATYAVSNAVNNGSGLVRLTIATSVLQTGDRVVVKDVGGATGATGPFIVTVINATTIDLQGSTFGGAYTSGGTVTLSAWYRSGIGIHLDSVTDWGQADTCFTFDYATGIKITGSDNGTLVNCGTDGTFSVGDTSTRGIWVEGDCSRAALLGCKTAAAGVNLDIDVDASEGDCVTITNHRTWGAVTYAARLTDGAAKFVNCGFQTTAGGTQGVVRVEAAAEEPLFVGGDMEGVTFSYATGAPRPSLIGVRGAATSPLDLVTNGTNALRDIARYDAFNSSPAANDGVRQRNYTTDSAGAQIEIGRVTTRATSVTAGSVTSEMFWGLRSSGTLAEVLQMRNANLFPAVNDGMALGFGTLAFSDLFLASGGVINWNNGNYTITHSTDLATFNKGIARGTVTTKTADFTWATTETHILNNKSGSACVATMPTASSFPNREIYCTNYQAQQLNSAASNIVPLGGGAAGTAILSANAGRWAKLVSDGTNWVIVAGVI